MWRQVRSCAPPICAPLVLQSPLRGPLQKKAGRSGAASKDDTWVAASFILSDVRFTLKADICSAQADVRFVPKADIPPLSRLLRRRVAAETTTRPAKRLGGLHKLELGRRMDRQIHRKQTVAPKAGERIRYQSVSSRTLVVAGAAWRRQIGAITRLSKNEALTFV